ncbi:MAG: hypothetical protein HWD61_01790 [Parachlamydiaceae bacterium]|nr:MAG: hypothetical protein HWD61_01790 [Parachlamydiaceae bacterium]
MKERINKSILGFGLSGGILLLGLALFHKQLLKAASNFPSNPVNTLLSSRSLLVASNDSCHQKCGSKN